MNMQAAVEPKSALKPRQSYVKGKIISRRKITTQEGSAFLTLVRLPAPDEYTSPSTIEIQSRETLGETDENFSGIIEIRGFPRSFEQQTPDGNKKVHTATNILFYVG